VGPKPLRLAAGKLDVEKTLENMILSDSNILSEDWMLIGHQVPTNHGPLDLLAIDRERGLVVIELKRAMTPREVVMQAVDYAACIDQMSLDDIRRIYKSYAASRGRGQATLEQAFQDRFGVPFFSKDVGDESFDSGNHLIIIVAAEADARTEAVVQYLNERYDVPINVLFFEVFRNGAEQILSRSWVLDPLETQVKAVSRSRRNNLEWNGEFCATFGEDNERSWEEAREYGFFCAGGGAWYSARLRNLTPGALVWVYLPNKGYVGVGEVIGVSTAAPEFQININGQERPALDVLTKGHYHRDEIDPEKMEYFVPMQWRQVVSADAAFREPGMLSGNQNPVFKPVSPSWGPTVEKLKLHFPNWNGGLSSESSEGARRS
jgi:hypothetical protein